MNEDQTQTPAVPLEFPGQNNSTYGDGDIPEIDLPKSADATPAYPVEFP